MSGIMKTTEDFAVIMGWLKRGEKLPQYERKVVIDRARRWLERLEVGRRANSGQRRVWTWTLVELRSSAPGLYSQLLEEGRIDAP